MVRVEVSNRRIEQNGIQSKGQVSRVIIYISANGYVYYNYKPLEFSVHYHHVPLHDACKTSRIYGAPLGDGFLKQGSPHNAYTLQPTSQPVSK